LPHQCVHTYHNHRQVKDWATCSVDVADVRALRVSLNVNLAAAHNKLEQWQETLGAVEKVMTIEAGNKKAMFRRGVAYQGLGMLDEAKEDFTVVAKADPKNGAARQELAKVKEAIKVKKAEEKERMKGLFAGKGLGISDQKEKEEKAKAKTETAKKKKEDAAKAEKERLLKEAWTAEATRREEAEEESVSWEEYEKEAKSKEEAATKAAEDEKDRKKEEARKARNAERSSHKAELEVDSDDEKLLEDIKKQGYCYFGAEGAHSRSTAGGTCGATSHSGQLLSEGDAPLATPLATGGSAWNAAGTTVEEKDYTKWATDRLEGSLLQVSFGTPEATVKVTKVSKCEGLANVFVTKGQGRPHADLHVTCDWEANLGDQSYKGSLNLPEVTIEDIEARSLEIRRSFKKEASAEHAAELEALVSGLEDRVASDLEGFVGEIRAKC